MSNIIKEGKSDMSRIFERKNIDFKVQNRYDHMILLLHFTIVSVT